MPSSGQSAQQSGLVGGSSTFWILLIVRMKIKIVLSGKISYQWFAPFKGVAVARTDCAS
jgi:hypothetical protein